MTLQKVDLAAIRALGHDADLGTLQVLVETPQGYQVTALPAPLQALEGLLQLNQAISGETVSTERQQEKEITMFPVNSTTIAAIGYCQTNRVLQIDFLKGTRYRYLEVPPQLFREFALAPSKGRFFNATIKRGGFKYQTE
jgi:hypothetical protein